MAGLMEKASAGAPQGKRFSPPDISGAVPSQVKDAVDRVVAAGMKIMFSPEMKDERQAAVQSPDPIPKKLAENVTGLLLTLDQQAKGGIPVEALFPAAVMLLSEAAEMLSEAGQDVSEEDYHDAARMLFVLIGKKLGGTDEQIMGAAKQAMPPGADDGDGDEPADEGAGDVDPSAGGMPPGQMPPPAEQPMPDVPPPRPPMPRAAMQGADLPDEDVVQ